MITLPTFDMITLPAFVLEELLNTSSSETFSRKEIQNLKTSWQMLIVVKLRARKACVGVGRRI